MADPSYYEVLTAAVEAIARHGYTSADQVDYWTEQLRLAAERTMGPLGAREREATEAMAALYRRLVDQGGALSRHPGVDRFTLEKIRPQLRAELSRRIAANVDLIKLNRERAIAEQTRRFRGWATSVPEGGAADLNKREQKVGLRKSLASLPFEDRRCTIDQTHKLNAAIHATIAENGGAIAARWMSHKHQAGYDGRPAHNARDGHVFLIRGSWAQDAGFVKPGTYGYTDQIEQPAEFVFCRCWYSYIYSIRDLPEDMVTVRGREALTAARAALAQRN